MMTAQNAVMSLDELREKVAGKLAANPGVKTGMMADSLGVPEADILRAMPPGHATELLIKDMAAFIPGLEKLGLVYFVTRNGGCVCEIRGRFGGFSRSGPFLNVNGDGLHLHVRPDRIATVFHVNPPSSGDKPAWPSLQFFLADGSMTFKVFLIAAMQEEAGEDHAASVAALNELVASTNS